MFKATAFGHDELFSSDAYYHSILKQKTSSLILFDNKSSKMVGACIIYLEKWFVLLYKIDHMLYQFINGYL